MWILSGYQGGGQIDELTGFEDERKRVFYPFGRKATMTDRGIDPSSFLAELGLLTEPHPSPDNFLLSSCTFTRERSASATLLLTKDYFPSELLKPDPDYATGSGNKAPALSPELPQYQYRTYYQRLILKKEHQVSSPIPFAMTIYGLVKGQLRHSKSNSNW